MKMSYCFIIYIYLKNELNYFKLKSHFVHTRTHVMPKYEDDPTSSNNSGNATLLGQIFS